MDTLALQLFVYCQLFLYEVNSVVERLYGAFKFATLCRLLHPNTQHSHARIGCHSHKEIVCHLSTVIEYPRVCEIPIPL
jgi:hypothetical protein